MLRPFGLCDTAKKATRDPTQIYTVILEKAEDKTTFDDVGFLAAKAEVMATIKAIRATSEQVLGWKQTSHLKDKQQD